MTWVVGIVAFIAFIVGFVVRNEIDTSKTDDAHKWNEVFARLTREDQEKVRADQIYWGAAIIRETRDGRVVRHPPDEDIVPGPGDFEPMFWEWKSGD